ncbi:MAG: siphovirus Gp157 family protein [Candidatus Improbicoccus devescovinae]|nr:MAG: siphovirus Gp157 family protein [Candidatus Improbicoccus devescovinae]
MKLYEISEKYFEFLSNFENGEISEEEIDKKIKLIAKEFDEKADSIACLIKNLNAEAEAIAKEVSMLKEREKYKSKLSLKLSDYLKSQMKIVGRPKIETARNKLVIRKNPESIEFSNKFIDWARESGEQFLKFLEPEINKNLVKEKLKNGEEIPFAKLIQKERLEIK